VSAPGTLHLCATPIGNLKDITLRCLETLQSADLILAEDTRQTRKLLNHYELKTPLKSFHAHNEQAREQEILERLAAGEQLALVSDAGLPLISDPGAGLVRAVQDAGFKVTCLPGPSAPTMALLLSGLAPLPFCFLGFFPRQAKQQQTLLKTYLQRPETLVFFESPHRLAQSLAVMAEVLGNREAAVCRELTKFYEEVCRAPLAELQARYQAQAPKGEITLVVAGCTQAAEPVAPPEPELLLQARTRLEAQGLSRKQVLSALQAEFGLSRNALYALLHSLG